MLRPFAPVLGPVLAPMIIYMAMRILRPALLSDLPVLRRLREIVPDKEELPG